MIETLTMDIIGVTMVVGAVVGGGIGFLDRKSVV